jgi:ATP-binding cassette, subfamily B, bacterial
MMNAGAFVPRLLPYLRPYAGRCVLILLGLLLEMAFFAAVSYSFRFIVDGALLGGDLRLLVLILAALVAGAVVVAVMGLIRDYQYARVSSGVLGDMRARMFRHLQELSMDFYSRSQAGDLISHFSTDLATIETATTAAIPWAILPGLDVLSNTALMFVIDWRLALVAMLVWPATLIGPRIFAPRVAKESYHRKQIEARALNVVQEHVYAQPVVQAFGLKEAVIARFLDQGRALMQSMARLGFYSAMVERSAGIGIMFLQVLVLGIGAVMVVRKSLTIGSLAAFQTMFINFSYSLSYVTQYLPMLVEAGGGMRRVDELLEEKPKVRERADPVVLRRLSREIELRDVSFGYSPGSPNLRNAAIRIPQGRLVAFVGPSGSGKSTVLNLVMRFYDADTGSIRFDGIDIREASLASLRSQMGIVFQESFLFDASIRENIRVGRPEATDAEVEEAARAAELHDAIAGLPQGYDTPVGERGGRLSGGQRQRVAIARAVLRDPEILVLDEATSALDPATESSINATLERLCKGRTTLSVTHRLASVTRADRIFVLDGGVVCEQGTHDELMAQHGCYRRLWDKQAGFALNQEGDGATVTAARLRDVPIFRELDFHLLEESIQLFRTESSPEGRLVTQEGDAGDLFYIIVRGKVEVWKCLPDGKETRVAVLSDGDHFGEIALLRAVRRTATVRTATPSIFLTMHRASFFSLVNKVPRLRRHLDEVVAKRILELDQLAQGGP